MTTGILIQLNCFSFRFDSQIGMHNNGYFGFEFFSEMVVAAVVSSVNVVVVKFCPCAVVPIITVVVIVLKKRNMLYL